MDIAGLIISFTISILANFSTDGVKKLLEKFKALNSKEYEDLLIDSLQSACESIKKTSDETAGEIINDLKSIIKNCRHELLTIFYKRCKGDTNEFLRKAQLEKYREEYREGLLADLVELYELKADKSHKTDLIRGVISDMLRSYRRAFFEQMTEKQGIKSILKEVLKIEEINKKIDDIQHKVASTDEVEKGFTELKDLILSIKKREEAELDSKKDIAWKRYNALLVKQINDPIFDEPFGLEEIYVPLRCYYWKRENQKKNNNHRERVKEVKYVKQVVMAEDVIMSWVKEWGRKEHLKIVSGDPGSGKSSLAKMLAAKLACEGKVRPIFIPLHKYILKEELKAGIKKFLKDTSALDPKYFDLSDKSCNFLLIFDGLDELGEKGKASRQLAEKFMSGLEDELKTLNSHSVNVKAVVTGRIISIQQYIMDDENKSKHELHLLSFYIEERKREGYKDKAQLLSIDQRDRWWEKYGELKGKEYREMPTNLRGEKLINITCQPLLNLLIARCLERGEVISTESNLNDIYDTLIESVYEREYEDRDRHGVIRTYNIGKDEYDSILEQIAIAAWHGRGRTVTKEEIEKYLKKSNNIQLLEKFEGYAKAGVITLLIAFYFREYGYNCDNERAFEFTHKSFREFLTAKRIVKELEMIAAERLNNLDDPETGLSVKEALLSWVRLFGPTAIDEYLLKFIADEVARDDKEMVRIWQERLIELMNYTLDRGMPLEKLERREGFSFKQQAEWAANSEEALLVLLNCCSIHLQERAKLELPAGDSFRRFLLRLEAAREERGIYLSCLSWLELSIQTFEKDKIAKGDIHKYSNHDIYLNDINLYKAKFSMSKLHEINFSGADLRDADFFGAELNRANFYRVDFSGAFLSDVDFKGANFNSANFMFNDLMWSRFEGVDMTDANLIEVSCEGAIFKKTNLSKTVLRSDDFEGALFEETEISTDDYLMFKESGIETSGLIPVDEKGFKLELDENGYPIDLDKLDN